jgi:hypothetical protein
MQAVYSGRYIFMTAHARTKRFLFNHLSLLNDRIILYLMLSNRLSLSNERIVLYLMLLAHETAR